MCRNPAVQFVIVDIWVSSHPGQSYSVRRNSVPPSLPKTTPPPFDAILSETARRNLSQRRLAGLQGLIPGSRDTEILLCRWGNPVDIFLFGEWALSDGLCRVLFVFLEKIEFEGKRPSPGVICYNMIGGFLNNRQCHFNVRWSKSER